MPKKQIKRITTMQNGNTITIYIIIIAYELYGGRYRTRTCDLLHVKQMLYQLS